MVAWLPMTPEELNELVSIAQQRAAAARDAATRWQYEKLAWAYGRMARRAVLEATPKGIEILANIDQSQQSLEANRRRPGPDQAECSVSAEE